MYLRTAHFYMSMKYAFYKYTVYIYHACVQRLTLNLPMTTIVAQPFNIIKWQVKFNPIA